MAKDALGNELAEGQLVQVTLDSRQIRGKIRAIQRGGIAVAGQQQVTAGMIVVNADILIPVNPQNPQAPNLVRLVDPEQNKPGIVH